MLPKVRNIQSYLGSESTVWCGRPSKWGNPFIIGKDGNRDEVIQKYKEWIINNEELLNSLHELKDKVLLCYCWPKKCHCDILVELIKQEQFLSNE